MKATIHQEHKHTISQINVKKSQARFSRLLRLTTSGLETENKSVLKDVDKY